MKRKLLSQNKKLSSNLFFNNTLLKEFDDILKFLSEIDLLSDGFITLSNNEEHFIQSKIGLGSLNNPYEISCFQEFVNCNKISILLSIKNSAIYPSREFDNTAVPFKFFTGFPINISNLFKGTLCILDKTSRTHSLRDLKIIKQSVSRIESLLQLEVKNQVLKFSLHQQKKKFDMFENNSNEILYEIDLDGIITYVSKTWTIAVGHEVNAVIGSSYSQFIHPDDIDKCNTYLSNIILFKKNDQKITYRLLHKKGHYVWHSSRVQLFKNGNKVHYIGICTDVTAFIENEIKLEQQKVFYETILNSLPTDVVIFDANHRYQYLNHVAIKNKELREFIIGKDDFEYAAHMNRDPSFAINRRERFLATLQKGETSFWEETLNKGNDDISIHNRKFTPVFDSDGVFKMMIGFSVNITESKKIEIEIIKSRELTKNILNNTAVGILILTANTEILESNFAASELLGINKTALLGKTLSNEDWHIENEDGTNFKCEEFPVLQSIKQLKPINKVVMGIHRTSHKDLIWVLVDAVPILNDQSELLYVICSFSDITVQKHTEQALKISNDRFKYATKATSDVIWDWEIGSNNIVVGENYTQLYGYNVSNPDNILSIKESFSNIHPLDLKRVTSSITETFNSKTNIWQAEFRYLKPDGSYAFVIGKAYILRDKKNKAIRMIGAHSDVTNEKKLRDKLKISEQHFRGAFEYSAVGFAIIDPDGYWIEANARLCTILGYSKEELKKVTCNSISYPGDLQMHLTLKEKLDQCLIPNFNMEKRYFHKNHSIVWVHLSVSLIKNNAGQIMHYITQLVDITERKKIEKINKSLIKANNKSKAAQLNEAKNLYQLLAENTVDLVCLHDLDGNFQYVSPSVYKLLGYNSKDLIGKNPLEITHPEDIEYLEKNFDALLTTKKEVAVEVRLKNKAGRYIWFESKANLVKVNGTPVSFHSGTREITKQREAQESIEKSLTQERKLNELRTNLVSTISHEFRTPMTTIRTSTELMELYIEGLTFKNSDRLQKHLYTITNEIDRIVELMNTVLTISREDSGKTNFRPIIFDLQQVCLDVIETSYSNQRDGRKVKTTIEKGVFPVLADKNLMEYALFNVLNNAFKYSEGCGNINLNLFISGATIIVQIEDFGIGIPKPDQHKLFNTFFRARNTNGIQGTGLGLYIVKTFTEKNSGSIKLESKLGKGTKITLEFPLHHIKNKKIVIKS